MEGSVSDLPVGPLSVLSHYTSIEFYITCSIYFIVKDTLNVIM